MVEGYLKTGCEIHPAIPATRKRGRAFFVITSYSIHYTKLYDFRAFQLFADAADTRARFILHPDDEFEQVHGSTPWA